MNAFHSDPLLVKELRTRLRARTATIIQILYVSALTAMGALTLVAGGARQPAWEAGQSLLRMLLYAQTLLLLFIAPLVAASAICAEKEQKTYDSLMATPVSARRVTLTKWVSALAVFVILMAISLPFAATAYLLGGLSPGVLAIGWSYTVLLTATAGTMGMYWSARFERSIAAIPAAAVSTVGFALLLPRLLDDLPAAVSGISPFSFLNNLFEGNTARLFGVTLPAWALPFAFLVAAMAAMTAATMQRVKFVPERRYAWMRAFSLVLWALMIAGIVGSFPTGPQRSGIVPAFMTVLIVLGILAPWIGASQPVIRSERMIDPATAGSRFRLLPRLLTGPVSYPLLLAGVAALGVGGLWHVSDHVGLSPTEGLLLFLSLLIVPATLALLAFRLSDRQSARGRWIGLAIAWILGLILLFAPLIIFYIMVMASAESTRLWVDLGYLLSPLTPLSVADMSALSHLEHFVPTRTTFGEASIWVVAPLFHAILFGLLALPFIFRRRPGP